MKKKDIIGLRFGRLVVLNSVKEKSRDNRAQWLCQCDCGEQKITTFHSLSSGAVRSCGCLKKEMLANRRLTRKSLKILDKESKKMHSKDWTGKKIGMVLVLGLSEERKKDFITWECRCDCGREVEFTSQQLSHGSKRSKVFNCGCTIKCLQDYTGQRFGMLTAIRQDIDSSSEKGKRVHKWICKCDCGNTKSVNINNLIRGVTKSCGCLKSPQYRYEGQRFGLLTAIEPYDDKFNSKTIWKCKCDCGNEVRITAKCLSQGYATSCGCDGSLIEEDDADNWCVYKHTNKNNGKVYIGKTCHKPEYRWNNGLGYKYQRHFWNAINKYGWDGFEHEIIFSGLNAKEAKQLEISKIAEYGSMDPNKGYNQTAGGEGMLGWHHTEESLAKIKMSNHTRTISEETKQKHRDNNLRRIKETGKVNFKGKHHSEETKQIFRQRNLEKDGSALQTHPIAMQEWDYEKNIVDPNTLTFGSGLKVWWKCSFCGKSFRQSLAVKTRSKDYPLGCPKCIQMFVTRNPNRISKMRATCKERGVSIGERNAMYGKHGKDNPLSKPVLQYSLEGKLIAEYESATDAKIATNISNADIGKVCKRNFGVAGGYQWRWKTENCGSEIEPFVKQRVTHTICQYDARGYLVAEYQNAAIASEQTGISMGSISTCASHKTFAKGYTWRKKKDVVDSDGNTLNYIIV